MHEHLPLLKLRLSPSVVLSQDEESEREDATWCHMTFVHGKINPFVRALVGGHCGGGKHTEPKYLKHESETFKV